MPRYNDKQSREKWLNSSPDAIPNECVSEILTEAQRLQNQQERQRQENCTFQELEKIAEEVNISSAMLRQATEAVLGRRRQQELERQQQERDRKQRRDRAIATLKQYARKSLPGVLAGAGFVIVGVVIKTMVLPFLTDYFPRPAVNSLPTPIPPALINPEPTPIPKVSASTKPKSKVIQLPGAKVNLDSPFGRPPFPGASSVKVTGTLKSIKFCNYATLNFQVYDSDGNRLGNATDIITNLKAGEVWQFKITSDERGAYRFEIDSFSCKLIG